MTALIADIEEKLRRLLNVVTKESEILGLKVCVMAASKIEQGTVHSMIVNRVQIE